MKPRWCEWMRYLLLCCLCIYFILRLFIPAVHRAGWYHISQVSLGCDASAENPVHVFRCGMESMRGMFRVPLIYRIASGEELEVEGTKGTLLVVWDVSAERIYVHQLQKRRRGKLRWRQLFLWPYPPKFGSASENLAQFEGFGKTLVLKCPKNRRHSSCRRMMADARLYVEWHENSLWLVDAPTRNAALLGAFALVGVSVWYWGWVASVYAQLRTEFPEPRFVPLSFWKCALARSPAFYEKKFRSHSRHCALDIRRKTIRDELEAAARQRSEARRAARNAEGQVAKASGQLLYDAIVSVPKTQATRIRSKPGVSVLSETTETKALQPATLSDWNDRFLGLCEELGVEWPAEIDPQLLATVIVVGLIRPSKRGICVGERYRKERLVFKDVKNKLRANFDANAYHSQMAWMANTGIIIEHKNAATVSLDQRSSKSETGRAIQKAWERLAYEAAKGL